LRFEAHTEWDTAGFGLEPVAADVGPFPHRAMMEAWWQVRGSGKLQIVEAHDALIVCALEGGTIRLVGEADLFDYHSPLGTSARELVAEWAGSLAAGLILEMDSLPAEAADVFMGGFEDAGLSAAAAVHESAAVLAVPGSFEEYLARLDKKQRHEARRKVRRFTEILGPPRLVRETGPAAVADFATMHRLANGSKGEFMSPAMESMFTALHTRAGAVIDFLYGDSAKPAAAAFGFESQHSYYLYNSAYRPESAAASPGIVLVSEMIRQTADAGIPRFDFLKGDEAYKYRLGAAARPLWRVRAVVEGAS